jgi:uncharacterized membrane protein YeaQ/YmgE (transglycosylase-associated protein family)
VNVASWLAIGCIIGWIAFAIVGTNQRRGLVMAVIIGGLGAYFGGYVLAPMIGAPVGPADFSPFALIVAMASAVGSLTIDSMLVRTILDKRERR